MLLPERASAPASIGTRFIDGTNISGSARGCMPQHRPLGLSRGPQ
jgi:hypothetical protein